ncbi:hypothetical protein KY321_02980 [Candidatus Woesearchaeota archaeon]|nr:hypothetical protein [Candidatus Woesearchaeota archaeon]
MINISEYTRNTLFKKIRSLRDPYIYLAENVSDYQDNLEQITLPWYKRFSLDPKLLPRAYILFQNIGLKKLNCKGKEVPNWFILHDGTGKELFYWNKDHYLFSSKCSFNDLKIEQGLKEDDWVYDILVRHYIRGDMASITEIRKFNSSSHKPDEVSLQDRIKAFFPDLELEPQFSY